MIIKRRTILKRFILAVLFLIFTYHTVLSAEQGFTRWLKPVEDKCFALKVCCGMGGSVCCCYERQKQCGIGSISVEKMKRLGKQCVPIESKKAINYEPNCVSRNLGDIRLGNREKIPEVSGITRRAPNDVYLISDRSRWLYRARLSNGRWSVDRYGITDLSEGTGPNKEGIYDIEDVTYGPCPLKSQGNCIFIGEIGGNPNGKNVINIHYIRESDLPGRRNKFVRTRKISYKYPDRMRFDAEGLAVHPRTGEIFIVTKTDKRTSYIYKVDPRFPERKPIKIIEIDLPSLFIGYDTNARQITGFEISPNGKQFALVTYEALVKINLDLTRVYSEESVKKLPGNTKSDVYSLSGDWWGKNISLRRIQVEAITYDGDGSNFLIIGEGKPRLIGLSCVGSSSVVEDRARKENGGKSNPDNNIWKPSSPRYDSWLVSGSEN